MSGESDVKIVTAVLMVHIVDEGPFLAVIEEYPDHAESPGKGGVFLFHHPSLSPNMILSVHHDVAQMKKQSLRHNLYYNEVRTSFLPDSVRVIRLQNAGVFRLV